MLKQSSCTACCLTITNGRGVYFYMVLGGIVIIANNSHTKKPSPAGK